MATAKKLPSGSWRCLAYSHTEKILDPKTGKMINKRIYESFTSDDPTPQGKREAEAAAAIFAADKEQRKVTNTTMTFGEALDAYIKSRELVLSPRTIMDYKRIRKNDIQGLMNIKLNRLTQEHIQDAINLETLRLSPKSIRNTHGLISAVLKQYKPNMRLTTILPKKVRPDLYIPTNDEVLHLMEFVKNTDLELPVLLAAFGPMRRGEISALSTDYISANRVHVCRNMVLNENHEWIIKEPKTYAGDRYIDYPDFVAEKWKDKKGLITPLNPNNITDRFAEALKKAGLPHFRFHDLRHYCASIQHAIGIPDAYIMLRGGWGDDLTLKQVYRHALDDQGQRMNQSINDYFTRMTGNLPTAKEPGSLDLTAKQQRTSDLLEQIKTPLNQLILALTSIDVNIPEEDKIKAIESYLEQQKNAMQHEMQHAIKNPL